MQNSHPNHINVTIPAYKETGLLSTLQSLLACNRTGIQLRISILINESTVESKEVHAMNLNAFNEVQSFITEKNFDFIKVSFLAMEPKFAGVGLARKTLMDEAAYYFRNKSINGIISALDADCTVEENYLQALKAFFENSKMQAASLYFEHPIDLSNIAIAEYEWHLRYFIHMQSWCGFPFAIHTVGSSMACLSESYLARGGMNKRKAGEDFYFLHKFIKDQVCGVLRDTCVYPSGRISDRVPFGTGRAMGKYEDESYFATTYNPESFKILKQWLQEKDSYFEGNIEVKNKELDDYLNQIDFNSKMNDLRSNVSSLKVFQKRFFQIFDAFQLMKCLHFLRDYNPDVSIQKSWEYY